MIMIIGRYLFLKKNLYYTSNDWNYYYDDDYILNVYEFSDEDYGEYDYDNDYDDDYVDDYYYDDDCYNFYDYLCYKRPLNYFKHLVSHKNNIVNWIDNNDYNHEITLLVSNHRICIC